MDEPRESPYREEVLDLIGAGYMRAEIADELELSSNAVKRMLREECRRQGTNMKGLYLRMRTRPRARELGEARRRELTAAEGEA